VHDLTDDIFSASPRDDNEFPIKLQCKLWPWLMAILSFWSTLKLLLGSSWSWSYGSGIYNYLCNQCLSPLTLLVRLPLRRGIFDTTLRDKVCQWLAAGQWFSPVSSTNNTDRHDITEILLKVSLNTITIPQIINLCARLLPQKQFLDGLFFSRYTGVYIKIYFHTLCVCFHRTLIGTPSLIEICITNFIQKL
jgi:hypothetical protein